MPVYYEQMIQVRHKSLILYDQPYYFGQKSGSTLQKLQLNISIQRQKTYSGRLTEGAKKRLSKAIDLLVQTARTQTIYSPVTMSTIKHRLSFITLTISKKENVTAREGYNNGLKHFLQWFRRTAKVTTYVWKCEVQKRGQIHYHITTPSYIHYQEIRDSWNRIQRHCGWLDDYYREKGHYDANSTDIKEVKSVKNLSGYLIKEFTKSIQNPNSDGKVWDCSINLKKFAYYKTPETPSNTQLISDCMEKNLVQAIPLENCIVIKKNDCPMTEYLDLKQISEYDQHISNIRTYKKK